MNLGISGKNAVVFAGSKGIGRAIARALALEGANVYIISRNPSHLQEAQVIVSEDAKGSVLTGVCDVGDKEQIDLVIKDAVNKLGSIDILINNQGGPKPGGFSQLDDVDLQRALDVNLISVFHSTKLVLNGMVEKGWGRIVNVLSISAKESLPNMLLSNMIRPAVLGFSKTVAQEYARHGVTINSILPSAVMTDRSLSSLQEKANKEGTSVEDQIQNISRNLPPLRLASPEELASCALYLCSCTASYINGVALAVDGSSSKGIF